MFVDDMGQLLANYRKTHLWGDYEKKYFTPGNTLCPPFLYKGISISMLICYDIEFPEPARVLAMKGVDLLIVPTALVGIGMTQFTVQSRACENGIHVLYVNRVGLDTMTELDGTSVELNFCGRSVLVGPDGREIIQGDGKQFGLLRGLVEPQAEPFREHRLRNSYFSDRRPDLYM